MRKTLYNISNSGQKQTMIIPVASGRRKWGCIVKGGEVDFEKLPRIVIDEFRKGLLRRITLELPKDLRWYIA